MEAHYEPHTGTTRGRPLALVCLFLVAAVVLALAGCGGSDRPDGTDASPQEAAAEPTAPVEDPPEALPRHDELKALSRQVGTRLVTQTEAGELDFLPGINLGATIPGTSPGELAIGREDYGRWFPMMAELGFRVIRVYTILPPAFYEELAAYNGAHPDQPLFLVHGVWIPEEAFAASRNLFEPAVRDGFREEISRAVAVVHGEASLPPSRGHAGGEFEADVSAWLLAWIVGVELDPLATDASDRANSGLAPFEGTYFGATDDATPTEIWLAEMMDHLATEEALRGRTMPIAFTNWPTTDPLDHPDEPLARADMVSIDANHVLPTEAWPGGTFASYHAYPYYPDFQRYEAGIADYTYNGSIDPYAGYLAKLRDHHASMPVVISEFGVPSSWAHAHFGPKGRDQGGHSEQEAMAIDAELLSIIRDQGLAGGFIFEWTDEWFKFTWNTIELELPADRRALWHNAWTNEAHFGLIATDPASSTIVVDGDGAEWEEPGASQAILESRGHVREVRATHDEAFLYLRIVLDDASALERDTVVVGFDIVEGDGGGLPDRPGAMPGADYAAVLGPDSSGRVEAAGHVNPFLWQFGRAKRYVDADARWLEAGSMHWSVQQLIVNHPLRIPTTGEARPAELIEAGRLRQGTADPADETYDSRTAWAVDENTIELRLPYQAIGVSDPSSLTAYRPRTDGSIGTEDFDRIEISVGVGDELAGTAGYAWQPWQRVEWRERPKAGLDVLANAVASSLAG